MSFDPNAAFTFAGLPWQFDTPQARQTSTAGENGRFDYNLGLGSGWSPTLLQTIGYNGPMPQGGTFYSGANSESGRDDSQADAQQAAAKQSLQDYLTQKGYYLGTSYATAGPGGFWNSGGSPEVQMFFDSNGNPVGKPAIWGGNDTMLQMATPIIMALTAGMGGEIAGAGGQAAGGAAGSVEGGGSGAALGSAEGSASGAFNTAGFTGQGFGQIPIQASNIGASMGNIANIGKTVIGGAQSGSGYSGGGNYVNSLTDGSMGDEFSLDPSIFGSDVGNYGVFDTAGFGGTYNSGDLPSIDYSNPGSVITQYGNYYSPDLTQFLQQDSPSLWSLLGDKASSIGKWLQQNPQAAKLIGAGLGGLLGSGILNGKQQQPTGNYTPMARTWKPSNTFMPVQQVMTAPALTVAPGVANSGLWRYQKGLLGS